MNDSEKMLSAFSELYFYKELVLRNLHFTPEGSTEKEVADLLINGGDFIIAIQLKSRNEKDQTSELEKELKWLNSKCKAAKRQVKESIEFINTGKLPAFENGRKKRVKLSVTAEIIPLIVFMNDSVVDDYQHVLYKHSDEGMDINCMSFHDFQKMCKALLSPMEIVEYLKWRLSYYLKNGNVNISIYMDNDSFTMVKPTHCESLCLQFVAEKYGIKSTQERQEYIRAFSEMLHKLPSRVVMESQEDGSYPLILFFAHFNRIEIMKFVERIDKALDAARTKEYNIVGSLRNVEQKYVIVFVSTHDGYALDMDFLAKMAREKGDFDILLQVFCYWESEKEFRIDYRVRDCFDEYL